MITLNFQSVVKHIRHWIQKISIWICHLNVRQRWILGVSVALVFLLFVTSKKSIERRQDWAQVKEGTLYIELIESGEIEAISQISIHAPMMWSEKLQIIDLIEEGTVVREGDLLVQFDDTDLQEELKLEKDKWISAKADMDRIVAQHSLQISEMENQLALTRYSYQQSQLSLEAQQYESEAKKDEARIELKKAEIELKKTETQLESQKIIHNSERQKYENQIRQSNQAIQTLEKQLGKLKILSPANGMVVYHEVGSWNDRERLRMGYAARPGEVLLSIPDLSALQVKCFINEVDRPKVHVGQSVRIFMEAYTAIEIRGTISQVAKLAQLFEHDSQLKGFEVLVILKDTDSRLRPGMTAKARILLDSLRNVRYISIGLVFEIQEKPVVFAYQSTKPIPVNLGRRNSEYIELLTPLKVGTRLSWVPLIPEASSLGGFAEKKKVEEIRNSLLLSFSEFESRGILYDYISQGETPDSSAMKIKTTPLQKKQPQDSSRRQQRNRRPGEPSPRDLPRFERRNPSQNRKSDSSGPMRTE